MAHFQQIVLDYLEHYRPAEYAKLVARHKLLTKTNSLVDELYEETERVMAHLLEAHPGTSEEERRLEAERVAIATVLPFPVEEEVNI